KGKLLRLALDDAVRKSLPKIDSFLRHQPERSASEAPAPRISPPAPANEVPPPAVVNSVPPVATPAPDVAAGKKFCPECGAPNEVIEQAGRDPGKLLQWVKEQTVFVAYQGVLRGPCGVLMDRVGNDLDRSLLLAQVVSLSGYEVRLARAQLTEAEGRDRLASP